ncbi:MAG: hypothetical protein Q4E64_10820 [Phascolarctobacterium sp.]|uniref:hypothetical protein n=1 Tax=Phascolarctobacterium sp. TaxID=2049039 RepID=UPI0026DA9875|nr:hypothetical protein [Phascolarctobacterium sp.]MDO4922299.1 hypothetical protein [Phascolarctobacterium sp.]
MKERIYDAATMWLTLSVIFFLVEYLTDWLEVVTLGGLVAGSFIEGAVVLLGLKLMGAIVSRDFLQGSLRQACSRSVELLKALIVTAAFAWEGVLTLCHLLPGYTLHSHALHLLFLLAVYPLTAIALELQIREKEPAHGN